MTAAFDVHFREWGTTHVLDACISFLPFLQSKKYYPIVAWPTGYELIRPVSQTKLLLTTKPSSKTCSFDSGVYNYPPYGQGLVHARDVRFTHAKQIQDGVQ